MPKARREHRGLRAIEACARRRARSAVRRGVPIRGRSAAVNQVRAEAISEGHRRNRSWAREHLEQRDEAWFKREIAPKLDGFSLKEIGKATGNSRGLLAHPRGREGACIAGHWEALFALVKA